ncbi:hypothetical protein QE429_000832 [Bacillus sp. SORGH_AS 510]|uniref:spore germination protein GerPB n=1 Tax=Bacillus sp. SORGH_AS_0510 TaxID=3041771 RepID=UPI002781DAE3|nr:spore germination protein GerPB [Bacillus sp. SORGH_AS_0510]MDQ1144005.1 hypothetical protein [Bacillus sp. SORGH_AS_0510]
MDQYLEQDFKINLLKIGMITNAGVLQIGVGAGKRKSGTKAGYTTIGEKPVSISAPAVPLQAAVRDVTKKEMA